MLRRWAQRYCDWDGAAHRRIVGSRAFDVLRLAVLWVCLLVIPLTAWSVSIRSGNSRVVGVFWIGMIAIAVGFGSTFAFLRRQRERVARLRKEAGRCLACGYDLRAHGEGERCPECGSAVKRDAAPVSEA